MGSMMPMPEEEPEEKQHEEALQAQEGAYEFEQEYVHEAAAVPAVGTRRGGEY